MNNFYLFYHNKYVSDKLTSPLKFFHILLSQNFYIFKKTFIPPWTFF